jgi:GGDEF domain-containing protein
MRSKNLIKRQDIVDRVRACPECKKSHLSFVDLCPNCKSLDIEQQKSLHCFNCGFVGPESNFKKNGVLVCSNCDTRLRHIGVDYDRPFEQFHCRSCSELFIEPEVTARCMECSHKSTPEQLNLEVIYSYELSEKGHEFCLYGVETASLDKLLETSLIPHEVFIFTANWLNKLAKRSEEQAYSLMALRVINSSSVVAKQGYAETQKIIQSLSQKVHDLIRSTDLVTRYSSDLYLLLLPITDFKGANVLKEKIMNELEIIQAGRESALEIGIALYSSSENGVSEEEIGQVITMLVNELQE